MNRKDFDRNSVPRRALFGGVLLSPLVASLFLISFLVSPSVASKKGVYHVVAKGVTLYRISKTYKVPIAKLMEANGLSSPSAIKVGSKIFIPGAKAILHVEPYTPLSSREKNDLERSLTREEKPIPAEPSSEGGRQSPPWLGKELDIIWPIQGKINSRFGPRGKNFHKGIDIASPSYQEVKAAMDGEVILARNSRSGYGNVVVLRHDLGFSTIYGTHEYNHCQRRRSRTPGSSDWRRRQYGEIHGSTPALRAAARWAAYRPAAPSAHDY